MSADSSRTMVKTFLVEAFPGHDFKLDEDIFALGLMNSLFAMQLIEFIEGAFGIRVETEDLEFENFQTIEAIGKLIERKVAGRTAA